MKVSNETQYPLVLAAGTVIEILCVWKSESCFWLRIRNPESGEDFDYRVLWVLLGATGVLDPEGNVFIILKPAKRWNQEPEFSTVFKVRKKDKTLRCLSAEEFRLLCISEYDFEANAQPASVMEEFLQKICGFHLEEMQT